MHTATKKRLKRTLIGFVISLVSFVLLWLSLPFWFPLLLRPVAAHYGVQFRDCRHRGFRTLTLHGVYFTNKAATVRVDSLDVLSPNTWLFRLLTADTTDQFIHVDGWSVQAKSNPEPNTSSPGSLYTNILELESISRKLSTWMPRAVLTNGTVRAPGFTMDIPSGLWSNGVLQAQLTLPSLLGIAPIQVSTRVADVVRFDLQSASFNAEMRGLLSTNASGLDLETSGLWLSNRFELKAGFGRDSLLPDVGTLQVPDFRLPAAVLGVTNYPDVLGSLNGEWHRGEFTLDLAAGTSFLSRTSPPPVRVTLKARGDTNTAVIHSAELTSPWLTAELSRDLIIHFDGKLIEEPAFLRISADLSSQSWLPVTGRVQGDATFIPAEGKLPEVLLRVSGADIGLAAIQTKELDLAGVFNWPVFNVTAMAATFGGSSHAQATGTVNLDSRVVTSGHVAFSGPFANRWLPSASTYQTLAGSVDLSGSFTNLTHRGFLEVTNFTTPGLRPLNVHAAWTGQGLNTVSTKTQLKSRQSTVALDAAVDLRPGEIALLMKSLSLSTNQETLLQLGAPVSLTLGKAGTNTALRVEPLRLTGAGGQVDAGGTLTWPVSGAVTAALRDIHSGLISDFIESSVPELKVEHLDLTAGWTNGPLIGRASILASGMAPIPAGQQNAQFTSVQGYQLTLQADLAAAPAGIAISNLLVTTRTSTVTTATGFLPVTISPGRPRLINIATNLPMQLSTTVKSDAIIWQELAERLKVRLTNPNLRVDLAGTWTAPNVRVHLTSQQVLFLNAGPRTPKVDALTFNAAIQPERASADVQFSVQGLPVTATGELPLDIEFWSAVHKHEVPSLAKATARLKTRESDLALFANLYPAVLSPQGEIMVDISLLPGGRIEGDLAVSNARTRPFPTVGPVRDINLGINFSGQAALPTATAQVGGSPVRLTGNVDLTGTAWLHGQLPPFKLTLFGTNVPLSRKPESIIRSDLDLTVLKTNGAPPLITGAAQLKNSFYLSDIRALLPSGGGSAPSRRPPYFSVDDPFFADWRLGVHVVGDRFLKVRSTLFTGEVSGNFQLQGTLKDPMAVGDLKIASGSIRFPFGGLNVQQGLVTLGGQDPYRPQLALSATCRQFGYDIRMDASGPADQPLLQFSSTPPLTSEEIVLMITTGQVPREQQVYSTVQRAQTFALFLGQDLLSQLGLADNAEYRLTVRSGEQITETGRPTYSIEYKLTPDWSVVGEYDRFNEYNVGLKWRVYSK